MNNKIINILTIGSMVLGFFGLGGSLACASYVESGKKREEAEKSRNFEKYVMEHPAEYEAYRDYDKMRTLESENEKLKNQLSDLRLEHAGTMHELQAYRDVESRPKRPGVSIQLG